MKIDVLSFEQYFGEMNISEEEKKKRIEFAKQMEELFIILFVLMKQSEDYFDTSSTEQRLEDILSDNGIKLTDSMLNLIIERIDDIADITQRHIDDGYYTSDKRAKLLAEEETNTFLNRSDYEEAIQSGMKRKQWLTMKDHRVRNTHYEVDDEIIPINDDFIVGGCKMAFPRDTKGNPEEIAGCRCTIKYLP